MASPSETLILVTGGAGFVGSHLVRRLLTEGYQVRVLDSLVTGKPENLSEVQGDIEWIEGDAADPEVAQKAASGATYVFHEAAIPSVPRSVRDPLVSHRANATGTVTMLTAARDAGVKRFIYAASSSAYGDTPTLPKTETMATDPLSPYAVDKLSGENYCRAFHTVYGMQTVALRYFNVFGPRQDPLSEYSAVIPRFIAAMLKDEEVTVHGDGEQSRDFTFVADVVQANLLALTAPLAGGDMCNIACGQSFTLNQLISFLAEIMQVTPRVRYVEARAGDVKHSLADISRAGKLLGYHPQVSFQEGLLQTVQYLKSKQV